MADTDVAAEAAQWVAENWDVDLLVGEWWQRLADAGGSSRAGQLRFERSLAVGPTFLALP